MILTRRRVRLFRVLAESLDWALSVMRTAMEILTKCVRGPQLTCPSLRGTIVSVLFEVCLKQGFYVMSLKDAKKGYAKTPFYFLR